jgi:hypothetical protein
MNASNVKLTGNARLADVALSGQIVADSEKGR